MPSQASTMNAVIHRNYGGPEVLELARVPIPAPRAGEVSVRVKAVALNPADKFMMLGEPAVLRLALGLRRPSPGHRIRGHDLAGTVVAVGDGVPRFEVGDEVFGSVGGALAEIACGAESAFAAKPSSLTFEQAAALPMAGLTALHALRDAADLARGQHVLVNGASGGVGTFAIQVAKARGATVTGVCSTRNVDLVRHLGADHVIDYTRTDVTRGERRYDVILDNVGNHGIGTLRKLLTPTGILLPNSGEKGPDGGPLTRVVKAQWHALFGKQVRSFQSSTTADDLEVLASMVDEGVVAPVIDAVFAFEATADAMARLATRHARGKVVVAVAG